MTKSIFITGATGYIGGALLMELIQNHRDQYSVTAMARSEDSAKKIEATGAKAVIGSYDKPNTLLDACQNYDILIHIGESADSMAAAKVIQQGLGQRSSTKEPIVYIHTSGTGVLADDAHGNVEGTKIFRDDQPEDIDALDFGQPHREIDVFVRDSAKAMHGKATTAIIIPPNIYGIGNGPVNKISIQTPSLIRFAIKNKFVPCIGKGINWWSNVHVTDLARGYVILMEHLLQSDQPSWSGYWFAETGQHQWKDIYAEIGNILHSQSLVESPSPKRPSEVMGASSDYAALLGGKDAYDAWGSNSRSVAERLRALGWRKGETHNVIQSIYSEVEAILKE